MTGHKGLRSRKALWAAPVWATGFVVAFGGCVQVLGDFSVGPAGSDNGDGGTDSGTDSGRATLDAAPEAEAGPPTTITDAVQVSAGEHHTCAIRLGGDVYCWGANDRGQLGVPTSTASSNKPVKVPTVSHARQVSAGYLHTCAVDTNAALWCWGANDNAQLGLGTTTALEGPKMVTSGVLSGVAQVSAGEKHTCAASSAGDVYCWGDDASAQISTSGTTSYPTPTRVALPANNTATQVSANSHHSCVAMQGSSPFVACWGTQSLGELGTSTTGPKGPTSPAISANILDTGAGHDHSCAVDSSHALWCWGGNASGQTGATPGASSPPGVVVGAGTVLDVATGGAFTCARNTAGEVYCFGSNAQAQLGGGGLADTAAHQTPAKVLLPAAAAQVSAGWQHACAVLTGAADGGAAAGPILCWGNNADGEIGDGTTSMNRPSPTPVVLP